MITIIDSLELKSLRVKHKLNQEKLAKYLNITRSAYEKKENNRAPFTLEEAYKIANLFKKSIEEIFFASKVHTKETPPLMQDDILKS